MKWNTEKRKLKDLIPYELNPRSISDKQKGELIKSLKKFSLVELPVVNKDNTIIAGHQRLNILLDIYGPELEVECRVPDKNLDEKDYQEYLLRSNRNSGDWDWEMLDDFDTNVLLDAGFEEFEVNVDKVDLNKIFENMDKETKTKTSKKESCPCCNNKYKLKTTVMKLPVEELDDMAERGEMAVAVSDFIIQTYPDECENIEIYILKR